MKGSNLNFLLIEINLIYQFFYYIAYMHESYNYYERNLLNNIIIHSIL